MLQTHAHAQVGKCTSRRTHAELEAIEDAVMVCVKECEGRRHKIPLLVADLHAPPAAYDLDTRLRRFSNPVRGVRCCLRWRGG